MVMMRGAVVFAQVPLLKSQLEELKLRSGTTTTKDALQAAVDHYLHCPLTQQRSEEGEISEAMRLAGREKATDEENWWWSPQAKEGR